MSKKYMYECREAGDEDWEFVSADDRDEAARAFAKQHELGYHEIQEMVVEVQMAGGGIEISIFKVVVDWSPTYIATELNGDQDKGGQTTPEVARG
mgnify:CR=1 FL=1